MGELDNELANNELIKRKYEQMDIAQGGLTYMCVMIKEKIMWSIASFLTQKKARIAIINKVLVGLVCSW